MLLRIRKYLGAIALALVALGLSVGAQAVFATSVGTNVSVTGTLTTTGVTTFGNNITVPAAFGLDTAAAGALNIGTTTATSITIGKSGVTTTIAGPASVNGTLAVGGGGTAMTSLLNGYCTIPNTTVTASSTAYANCTGATGVTSSFRVFLQATSSLADNFIIEAASSTVTTGTINIKILNTGMIAGTATGINSFNFWAVQ